MSLSAVLLRRPRVAAGLLTAVAVVTLAGCGSGDDSSGETGTTPAGGGASAGPGGPGGAVSAYFECLQQNGVTMSRPAGNGAPPSGGPDGNGAPPSGFPGGNGAPPSGAPGGNGPSGAPGGGAISKPDGVSDETWAAAQKACASLAPTPTASS